MSLSLKLQLRQELNLSQIIATTQLSEMPVLALDNLIRDVVENPDRYEGALNEMEKKKDNKNEKSGISCFFPLRAAYTSDGKGSGKIISPAIENIPSQNLQDLKIEPAIDGTYLIKKAGIEFIASSLLDAQPMQMLEVTVPKGYKKARQFYNFLMSYKNWSIKNLREGYFLLGKKQEEFLSSLDCLKMNLCPHSYIGDKLGLEESNVYRLFRNRYVAIKQRGKEHVLPSKFLFAATDKIFLYSTAHKMNKWLENEFYSGEALSDNKVSKKLGINRTTITVYRNRNDIPTFVKRREEYRSGRENPFRIVPEIDKYLNISVK